MSQISQDSLDGPEFYQSKSNNSNNSTEQQQLIPVSNHSIYAEEVLILMESVTRQGYEDIFDFQNQMLTSYINPHRNVMSSQKVHCYSTSMNHFVNQARSGKQTIACAHANDTQFIAAMKVIVLVARYAGK